MPFRAFRLRFPHLRLYTDSFRSRSGQSAFHCTYDGKVTPALRPHALLILPARSHRLRTVKMPVLSPFRIHLLLPLTVLFVFLCTAAISLRLFLSVSSSLHLQKHQRSPDDSFYKAVTDVHAGREYRSKSMILL